MNKKKAIQKKISGAVDEWKGNIAKLKGKASGAKADAQIEMNKQVKKLDHGMEGAGAKISELAEASEKTFGSIKKGVKSTWNSLKSALRDISSR
jgi:hypothetical protein